MFNLSNISNVLLLSEIIFILVNPPNKIIFLTIVRLIILSIKSYLSFLKLLISNSIKGIFLFLGMTFKSTDNNF